MPKKYKTQTNLYSHVKHHHSVHRYTCPEDGCCKTFAYRSKLDLHVSTHKPSLLYHCPSNACKSVCSTNKSLKAHVRHQHTHVKVYNCSVCSFHTENHASLNNHMRSKHSTGWMCDLCYQKFQLQTSYYRHVKKCVGPKEQCTGCVYPLL